MDSRDLGLFSEWFNTLAVTHRLIATEDLKGKMLAEYFAVLQPYPIEAVRSAYETLRRKMKKWPVPADWLEALPPGGTGARLPLLTAEEQAEIEDAERVGYERETYCHCPICEREQATHLKSRYVPRLDPRGQVIERRHPNRQGRSVILGRWIHGAELKRWISARAEFYGLKAKFDAELKANKSMTLAERIDRLATRAEALTR